MHLSHPFYKFPFHLDVARLQSEAEAIPEEAWCRHPYDLKGNSFLPLVATHGSDFDSFEAPMQPTRFLQQMPYIQQVLAQFKTLIGRTRFMRLEPGHGVPLHFDSQQYWRNHSRVHVPIVTNPEIRFHCGDQSVHMAAGEAWTFDNWLAHRVVNETSTRRIHLTMDTIGSTEFWKLASPPGGEIAARPVPFQEGAVPQLTYETYVGDPVISPAELDLELMRLLQDVEALAGNDAIALAQLRDLTARLLSDWRTAWHLQGPTAEGIPQFTAMAQRATNALAAIPKTVKMASNGMPVAVALLETFQTMVKPDAQPKARSFAAAAPSRSGPRFDRPVFIVSAPRSGSTLLFELLAANSAFWTLGGEGHLHVEQIEALHPRRRKYESNRLEARDATPAICAEIYANYLASLRAPNGRSYRDPSGPKPDAVRFLEKTPKNALRIPFFKSVFPDARFIFLHRDAKSNISAIIEAWRSGRFVTYRELPGWQGLPWSLLLIPGWRDLMQADIAEIATRQWRDTNETIMDDLSKLPGEDWCALSYEDLTAHPASELERLCAFADVPFDASMQKIAAGPLRPSRYTLTPPSAEKWRKNETIMTPFLDLARETADRLAKLESPVTVPGNIHGSSARERPETYVQD